MAERTLSGDTDSVGGTTPDDGARAISDREHDGGLEISAAKLPSVLGASVIFTVVLWSGRTRGRCFERRLDGALKPSHLGSLTGRVRRA
jgi:hypothetical protein